MSWPEQMQQHAEIALGKGDYLNAQNLAIQSWQQGTHHGALCERNWQVVIQARQHAQDQKGLALARTRLAGCSAPVKSP